MKRILFFLTIIWLQTPLFSFAGEKDSLSGSIPSVLSSACATVNVPLTATYCNGDLIPASIFTSIPAGATFDWTNSNVAIGLPAIGTGNIAAFPAVNISVNAPIVSVISVTPKIGACTGIASNFIITINPTPTATLLPLSQTEYCFGDTVKMTVNLTGKLPLAFYMNNTTRLYASPTYTRVITETNVGSHSYFFSGIDYVYDTKACDNSASGSVNFTIRPLPTASISANDSACFGSTKLLRINLTGTAPWYITYDSAGLTPVTIKRYTNSVFIPVSALGTWTYNVHQVTDSFCSKNLTLSSTIKIKPLPTFVAITSQTVCAGATANATSFTSIPAGGTFAWTNSNTGIGLAASGTGTVPTFTAVNTGSTIISGNISFAPSLYGCVGTAGNYTITVNPKPSVSVPLTINLCDGESSAATAFSSIPAGATYTWTNSNTAIGLVASGSGNVPSFIATNSSTSAISGTITVNPSLGACLGTSNTYSINLKPKPLVNSTANQNVCEGSSVIATSFTSSPSGASFNWTNTNASIGLPLSGINSLPSFTALNGSGAVLNSIVSVTPTLNGCAGTSSQFNIDVKPKPIATVPANQTVCTGALVSATSFSSTPAGASYTWTNSNTSIGLAAGGSGNLVSFTTTNLTTSGITGNISVTPTLNGCVGNAALYSITVNAKPSLTVPANLSICNGEIVAATNFVSVPVGASYTWTNSNTAIGLGSNGTGDVPSFNATNLSTASISGNITVIPSLGGCVGTSSTYTVQLKPQPLAVASSNIIACEGSTVAATSFASNPPGANFSWSNLSPVLGLGASGTTTVPSFTATLSGTGLAMTGTINVVPTLNGCSGPSNSYTVTVNPRPIANLPLDYIQCPNSTISFAPLTSTPSGASYTWTNSNSTIGLSASGVGNLPQVTCLNSSTSAVISTVSLVPTLNGCVGSSGSFTITVNPSPTATVPTSFTICDGALTSISNLSCIPSGATYSWVNSNTNIGLPASGSGNIPAFTASNSGSSVLSATISVTPTLNSCIGNSSSYSVTVNPKPSVSLPSNLSVCDGTALALTNLVSTPPGATYTWANSNTNIGLAASGIGNIPAFIATNSGTTGISGTISVTPTLNSCLGNSSSYSVAVNAKPSVNVPANQVVCDGDVVLSTTFTSIPTGALYTWANNQPSIGIGASGSGNVPSFNSSNPGTSPITAIISVTPNIGGCAGNQVSYNLTINPKPTLTPLSNQIVCSGASVSASNFVSTPVGASFAWTNDNTGIGLTASNTGNTPSFTTLNSGTTVQTSTITVVPNLNGCLGNSASYTIIVNPIPSLVSPINQIECEGANVSSTSFASLPSGSSYTWTNSNSAIGLAASGNGFVPSFTALNGGVTNIIANLSVTPTLNGCSGSAGTYTITIKPKPVATLPSNFSVCNGGAVAATSLTSIPAGAGFSWTNTSTSTGLSASGTGDVPAFIATNSGTTVLNSTISIAPTLAGCAGNTAIYTITVNPTPSFTIPANQSICAGASLAANNLISIPAGAAFNWVNTNTAIGLAATGSGNIPSFTAQNSSLVAINGSVTITPILNGCSGISGTYNLIINPQPTVNVQSNLAVCDGASISSAILSSVPSGATFTWTNNNTSIGLLASGTGDIPAFTASNGGSAVQVSTISISPAIGGCSGNPASYTVTVNPKPNLTAPSNQTHCAGALVSSLNLASIPAGAGFSWNNSNTLIGLGNSGSGNIPSFTATNTSLVSQTGTITIIPSLNGCIGNSTTYDISVNPLPSLIPPSNLSVCPGTTLLATNFISSPLGASFTWTNSNTAIGLASSGNGNLPSFNALNSSSSVAMASIGITPSLNGCSGTTVNYNIEVQPLPLAVVPNALIFCEGTNVPAASLTSVPVGATFSWSNSNTGIGLASNGIGDIPSFVTANTTSGLIAGTITVMPSLNACVGNPTSYTITVNPIATVNVPAAQTVCAGAISPTFNLFSSPSGALFSWTNTNNSIGLASNGTVSIPSFTALNSGTVPISGTVTVTPTYNGCVGSSSNFIFTVKPIPTIASIADKTVCDNALVSASNFTSNFGLATFGWTNSNSSIGLASSGTGYIAQFLANNTSNTPISATIDVNASFDGCVSLPSSFSITVNPRPLLQPLSNQTVCSGSNLSGVTFASGTVGSTFSWSNTNTSIGLASSGTGSIAGFAPTNPGNTSQIATVSVIPSYLGCIGNTGSYTITVNPLPSLVAPLNQNVCTGTNISAVNFSSSVLGTTFNWTNTTPQIGLAVSGIGDIASFAIQNPTASILNATISVVPDANGCLGNTTSFILSAIPAAKMNAVANENACVGSSISAINFSSIPSGASYTWTNSINDIGLALNGTGNIAAFTASNTTTSTHIATIVVTPNLNGCAGIDTSFTITVPPQATLNVPSDTIVCSGSPVPATLFTATPSTALFSWTSSNPNLGLPPLGSTFVPTFTPQNTSGLPLSTTITVTPTEQGCAGISKSYKIEVNSLPIVAYSFSPADATILFPTISFSNESQHGTRYFWDFADGEISSDKNPQHSFQDTGCYQVKLVSISNEGCRDSSYKEVCIATEFHVYVPNAFTPNDDGLNDLFLPVGMGVIPNDYELTIYNRKSTQIFSSTKIEEGWNGKSNILMINDKSPMDTYVYRIRCKDVHGKFHFFTGQVNLLR
jgi:gliding motility-associated-like protein